MIWVMANAKRRKAPTPPTATPLLRLSQVHEAVVDEALRLTDGDLSRITPESPTSVVVR